MSNMVRIRDAISILIIATMLFSVIPMYADVSDADGVKNNGILLYELDPKDATEGIALKNYSSDNININNYTIKNSSGKELVLGSYTIEPGCVIAFIKKTVENDWFCEETTTRTVVTVSDSKVTLKNTGDAVYLYDADGKLIDATCFGNYTASAGWTGIPVDLGYKEHVIRRVEPTDTNTYFDWAAVGDGYTAKSYADTKTISADVKPFTFPESGGVPILESLKSATETVDISIYMLTSGYVCSILADLENNGVEVRLILENKPLGYEQDGDLLKAIVNAGAEVKFIGGGSYDRYSYVHNKFAVIDGDEVIITSENWTTGNISTDDGNRGWGAVVYSSEFATEMSSFFTNDWNFSEDFISFNEKFPDATAKSIPTVSKVDAYIESVDYDTKIYKNVDVSIYMSPDNTFKTLMKLIDEAEERVYTEQMDIGASYETFATTSPLSAMISAADRGVDARFLLTKSGNTEFIDKVNTETNIKAGGMTPNGYATMHNKGVIIDDMVWVSSVNWTENAFMNNRECGLLLRSAEITDFYLSAYMKDWDHDYKLTDILTVVPNTDRSTFTVSDTTGTVTWTVYNTDGTVKETYTGNTIALSSTEGVSHIKVEDGSGNTGRFVMSGYSASGGNTSDSDIGKTITENAPTIGIGAVILAVIVAVLKMLTGKSGKKKGKKSSKKRK
jgi:phosphatidylserine/phosphatidylglycerophosphate/cardiolipin synthase-like enzyme